MKPSICFLVLLAPVLSPGQDQSAPPPEAVAIEREVAELRRLSSAAWFPENFDQLPLIEQVRLMEKTARARAETGMAILSRHPQAAQRWDVMRVLVGTFAPYYARDFAPLADGEAAASGDVIHTDYAKGKPVLFRVLGIDADARQAFLRKQEEWKQLMLTAPDAPADVRENAEWAYRFATDFRAVSAAQKKGEAVDYAPFRARFDAHVAKFPEMPVVARRANDYLGALERNAPGASEAEWRHLLDSPSTAVRERAAAELKRREMLAQPIELKFTAVDGREVDLAKLRGKVVLVDFWATWCGPCIAELPNVKQVYAAYHDRGFEVVGISLENAQLRPNDTPEQTAGKLAKAKKVLTDFTAKEQMPWPQYFDGKFWKNDLSTRYEINSIPAMFLIDQNGKLVTTNARGEKLEAEVKRLLKL